VGDVVDELRIEHVDEPSADDSGAVRDGLVRYNLATVGRTTHYPVVFHLLGAGGQFLGGITGDVWLERLSIEFLWIEASLRGRGYGQRLLEAAERYAIECGATHAHLDTYDFQAGPRYYERQGYEVFGVLGEAPEPISYFMQKRLASSGAGQVGGA
jgi:GNAT superfamily N-acetyltransferase